MGAVWHVIWGATWGNNMSAAEWGTVASVAGYLARDRIGRRAGQWLAGHIAPHLEHPGK